MHSAFAYMARGSWICLYLLYNNGDYDPHESRKLLCCIFSFMLCKELSTIDVSASLSTGAAIQTEIGVAGTA